MADSPASNIMTKPTPAIFHKIGLAGLAHDEHPTALKLGGIFNIIVALLIILVPILWFFNQDRSTRLIDDWVTVGSWLIWSVLLIESTLMIIFVRDPWRYIKSNWLNIPIIILTFPMIMSLVPYAIILRIVQFMLFARYLSEMHRILQRLFRVSQLGTIMLAFFIIVLLSGIIIHTIDPAIPNIEDGLWWALATMATVGYGDVVPKSTEGRAFGALIIILGTVFFSLLTAQLAAYLVGEDELARDRELLTTLKENQKTLLAIQQKDDARLEQLLVDLTERMSQLEVLIAHANIEHHSVSQDPSTEEKSS